jgi:hypothetical protein
MRLLVSLKFGLVLAICILGSAVGCTASRDELSVGARDPALKIPGMKRAVREKDLRTTKQLVEDLDSDDPAVRFYAINALRRLTGEDYQYRYYDDEVQRKPALAKWEEWQKQREEGAPTTRPNAVMTDTSGQH